MQYSNRKLTVREMSNHLARAKTMRAAGVEIDIPEEWMDCEPLIIRAGDVPGGQIFDTHGGSAAYAIWVQLVARTLITLSDCQITSPWDDQIVLGGCDDRKSYKLGNSEFPKRGVLNSRLENGLSLHRGQLVEGTILACGLRPIPACYPHGCRLNCTVMLLDQYERVISREVSLFVDRTARPKNILSRTKEGIYGGSPQDQPESINVIMSRRYIASLEASKTAREKVKKIVGPTDEVGLVERSGMLLPVAPTEQDKTAGTGCA